MNFAMKLHYQLLAAQAEQTNALPIVLIHGLFGNLDNLGVLARDLHRQHPVVKVDLRNHGLSPHAAEMNYPVMAQDLLTLLDSLNIERAIVIGHSMGGKAAMALTAIAPERIAKLVVIDIAPVAYQTRHHDEIFAALQAVSAAGMTQRQQAAALMRTMLDEEGVIQFLLKSFHQGEWRFNLPVLIEQYETIIGWQPVPAWPQPILFIRGGLSPYVKNDYRDDIARQFPQARAYEVAGSGHWVHAEKPDAVLRAIHRFIDQA
ncbi:esterase [Serratia odorifera]|uniref:Hydrolase, alpha/beta domain protein n=2 Tax=Serratia odorifera TaxID=618 RepID=D4E9M6_SEROD|nr:esterase [Serratia odorifera]EFE93443.1 hydrolase, alpha/beta domain protein [Serratia odorifera DSM 4582]PNK88429.1 alpha/beta hydrolase [Serratia odorifera]RII69328.1 esterase [Serratia odorifera]VDZ65866.1 Esterase ybfF [Serratia odorifera]